MAQLPANGRQRAVVERVWPEIDCGRYPVKRIVGDRVIVEADAFADGHDALWCHLLYRHTGAPPAGGAGGVEPEWIRAPMELLGNDRWRGEFPVSKLGQFQYSVESSIDPFETWRRDLIKRIEAGQNVDVDLRIGAALIQQAAERASGEDATRLANWAGLLATGGDSESREAAALDQHLAELAKRYPDHSNVYRYHRDLRVTVDPEKARFSTWYEVFPRSCSSEPGRHGTLLDCEALLPHIASMHFDVVYLPPIHPIGHAFRKGKNNSLTTEPGDPGSPWAIGSVEGGHTSVHPQLGTLEDFRHFVGEAKRHGLEVALDIAFQGTPDHPYVRDHPEWFRRRPDGTIQYAENPPKKYQDIYPFDFESANWQSLWQELKTVFLFWKEQGVRIFRVDNPHTKAFAFWEWVIGEIKGRYPDVLFLAEAFTRPHVMYRLAKLGFSQSYSYFTWRNTKQEITDYFRELTNTELIEYFRPNLWPNTPDILSEYLQAGGRPAFMVRLILAATLGSNYGIYGPAFELCENVPREPGSEEYLNSEKYEIKHRDLNSPVSLKNLIARVNQVRRENPALQRDQTLRFHDTDNPFVICYSKTSLDLENVIIVTVNLDPEHTQSSWVLLDLAALGLPADRAFQVHDQLSEARYLWQSSRNYVELTPESLPAHILRVRTRIRSERDFDYYL
ncbi:MAG TPA: alpha-1,4-glucan--maltose-1-phosphate maltosyltransferase [Bryobacteraceae bacterium]